MYIMRARLNEAVVFMSCSFGEKAGFKGLVLMRVERDEN